MHRMLRIGLVLISMSLWARPGAAQCVTVQPVADWVCVNGGWVPPDHPLASAPVPPLPPPPVSYQPPFGVVEMWPPSPTDLADPNAWIIEAAKRGIPLPPGDVWFMPPLRLRDLALLTGTAGRTVLRPMTTDPVPMVIVESSIPGHPQTGYPLRQVLRDLTIICSWRGASQVGLDIRGANITLERVAISNCTEGIRFTWAVNISIVQSQMLWNTTGLFLQGSGWSTITTIRIRDSIIGGSSNAGIVVHHGHGITIDTSIIEGNPGIGIQILEAQPRSAEVLLRDVWFELNGIHIVDPERRIQGVGLTNAR